MFNVGLGEAAVLLVLALAIFGDRLPSVAAQAARALRQLREITDKAKRDLQEGLGPEYADFDIADLNPRRFIQKHLFEDFDDPPYQNTSGTDEPLRPYGERPPYDPEAT